MTPIPRLTALTLDAMSASDARRALVQGHQAAYFAGVKERTGVMPKGLSKVERAELKQILQAQLERWDAFQDTDGLSEAQTAARLAMYSRAVGASYYMGYTGGA